MLILAIMSKMLIMGLMNDLLTILLLPSSELLCIGILTVLLACGYYRLAVLLLFMSVFATLFNSYLKSLWQIPLPVTANSTGWAFPSGHMHFASTFWLTLTLSLGRKYLLFTVPMLCSLGYALVAKGYHYPMDIFPAAFLGACEALYAHHFLRTPPCYYFSVPLMICGTLMYAFNPQSFTLLSVSFGALLILGCILEHIKNRPAAEAFQLTLLAIIFVFTASQLINFNHLEPAHTFTVLFSIFLIFAIWRILITKNQYAK